MKKTWMRAGVALTAAGALAIGLAGTASADDHEEPARGQVVTETGWDVYGTPDSSVESVQAALIGVLPDGQEDVLPAYCIQIHNPLREDLIHEEGTWDESTVENLPYVQWILHNGFPNKSAEDIFAEAGEEVTLEGEELEQAFYTATQAAVWSFTDAFALDPADPTSEGEDVDKAVAFLYDYLVTNAEEMPPPATEITFEGPDSFDTSELGGPFKVTGPGEEIQLSATGATITDADGNEITSVKSGGEFYVNPDTDVTDVSIKATAATSTATGSVFMATDEPVPGIEALGEKEFQNIILAKAVPGEVEAELGLTLDRDDSLPVTGASLTIAGLSGLLLLVAGGVTLMMVRRRKVAASWGDAA